ncbi:hypothetical protein BVG19_g5156 [[Candida] boidinii]|nr:hypothetical protein BVG19_g5156 [[Candida] boidinii]OWB53694.1 hypothetical protein B5S27_g5301 [[Candida] boidinii]
MFSLVNKQLINTVKAVNNNSSNLIFTTAKAPFHTTSSALISNRALRKLASQEKKKNNKALQFTREEKREKVDPVLGRGPSNPFIHRIRQEIEEPNILSKGFELSNVDKLLFGAKQSRLLNDLNKSTSDSERTIERIEKSENEKREILLRILSMRNSDKSEKKKISVKLAVEEFQRDEGDTGSSEVQSAILTVKIHNLMEHVKQNPQDLFHIRKLRMTVQKRQKLLRYLKRDNPQRYFWAIEKLGLTDENVHQEFNMDKKYLEEFQVWPGRKLVKISKKESESRKKERRSQKQALRRAIREKQSASATAAQ